MEHLTSTEAVVRAIREIADGYDRECLVTHDIGADQTSRRTTAGIGATTDPDGSLPHEAYLELSGSPAVEVRVFPEEDVTISVDAVEFQDVPRDDVPSFLHAVYGGLAHVKGRFFPPGWRLVVPLPGDRTYKEHIPGLYLTPWLSGRVR
ncbi:hypothetical protein [Streptomyces apocyni]|uniref:hypothetical protein n=1 Tax=Streptomyces apocyni TaxID=2654677 RepID=UPI0012EA47A4|nr:hypothetical protein [Streptomyces apocyni]